MRLRTLATRVVFGWALILGMAGLATIQTLAACWRWGRAQLPTGVGWPRPERE